MSKENLKEYVAKLEKRGKKVEEQFLVVNHGGFQWEAIKEGRVYSSSPFGGEINTVGTHWNKGGKDPKVFKNMVIAILKEILANNLQASSLLAKELDYDCEISFEEALELMKLSGEELADADT